MSKYKPLTYDERKIIEKMCKSGSSSQEIADAIDRTYSTIYRELRRCPLGKYSAEEAQKDALKAKENQQAAQKMALKTRMESKEKEYKKIIRTCLKINPQADILDVKIATGFPIERVEKYYDKIHDEVVKN